MLGSAPDTMNVPNGISERTAEAESTTAASSPAAAYGGAVVTAQYATMASVQYEGLEVAPIELQELAQGLAGLLAEPCHGALAIQFEALEPR